MRPLQHWLKTRVLRRAWASGRLRLKVTQNCVTALEPWKAVDWYQTGVNLGVISKLIVVSTDASNSGWGALYEGRPTFGLWSSQEKSLHINCLEMKAVENTFRFFLPLLKGHHVLVCTDNMSVVSYINRQGSLRSRNLHALAERILVWVQRNLLSLRAAHVPGHLNVRPDRLSRDNVPPGEWSLHPQTVQLLWDTFGTAEVDLSRQRSVSNMLHKEQGRAGPSLAQPPSLCFPSDHAVTTGNQAYKGERFLCTSSSSVLAEPSLVSGADAASELASVACPVEERSPLTGRGYDLAPTT
jgi:hypothetical protein